MTTWAEKRWSDAEMVRVQRRFRHHVRTDSNPTGRIHREICYYDMRFRQGRAHRHAGLCHYTERKDRQKLSDAHHPDYRKTWCVIWLCAHHHRMIEQGKLRIFKSMLWDYTSLIEVSIGKPTTRKDTDEVPF